MLFQYIVGERHALPIGNISDRRQKVRAGDKGYCITVFRHVGHFVDGLQKVFLNVGQSVQHLVGSQRNGTAPLALVQFQILDSRLQIVSVLSCNRGALRFEFLNFEAVDTLLQFRRGVFQQVAAVRLPHSTPRGASKFRVAVNGRFANEAAIHLHAIPANVVQIVAMPTVRMVVVVSRDFEIRLDCVVVTKGLRTHGGVGPGFSYPATRGRFDRVVVELG
mmetsp:Transcript_8264/g.17643  ORF Transcript_8264/g.17643 Transcript_8264/m.17643 type:complete len:220 (+) Transcript_8264:1553-2212(+)